MANIFSNAVNFLGDTLKQVATPDSLKDYRHANLLFVGSNFRLLPKFGFLFHVYFDINPGISQAFRISEEQTELGMMVKSVDLPKYTIDTKTYNSYNRPNIVQSKIKFDTINVTFHDDNANLVRDFWYDYYKFYYRDSDYTEARYNQAYKYATNYNMNFGYSPRQAQLNSLVDNYLTSVRIYSLHQKRFSEYILINPVIKSFKHGNHSQGSSDLVEHTMVLDYENILYQGGTVGPSTVKGFATLHYDLTPSPAKIVGGSRSVFGAGGLLDTADEVLSDLSNGNFGAAIFKAARGINTARGMNVKQAALSELTGIVNATASAAIQGQVNQAMGGTARPTVPTLDTIDGARAYKFNGIETMSSTAQLAGAALLLNSLPQNNRAKTNPVTQATVVSAPTNYNPRLPNNVSTPAQAASGQLRTLNDQAELLAAATNQVRVDIPSAKINLDRTISQLTLQLNTLGTQAAQAAQQVTNTSAALGELNSKLIATQALTPSTPEGLATKNALIVEINQQITQMTNLNTVAQQTLAAKSTEITATRSEIADKQAIRASIQ